MKPNNDNYAVTNMNIDTPLSFKHRIKVNIILKLLKLCSFIFRSLNLMEIRDINISCDKKSDIKEFSFTSLEQVLKLVKVFESIVLRDDYLKNETR